MKLFQVVYEEDGERRREPERGGHSTEIRRVTLYYAAELIDEVWTAVEDIRVSEDRTLVVVAEAAPLVIVIGGTQQDSAS